MNKNGLVAEVAKRSGENRAEVARVVDAAMATIRETVARGERVSLVGFGTFEKRRRAKRLARNPRKPHVEIPIPARDVPSFAPGKEFRELVASRRRRAAAAKPTRRASRR